MPDSEITINKPIAIPLHGFEFRHTSDPSQGRDYMFVGRKIIIDKLVNLLNNKPCKRGSYLIAGYRGVGKTSVVKKAIKEIQIAPIQKYRSHLIVNINLGDNSSLTPLNIYFSMANILRDEITSETPSKKNKLFFSFNGFFRPVISIYNVLFLTFLLFCIFTIASIQNIGFISGFSFEHVFPLLLLPSLYWLTSLKFFPAFKLLREIDELIEAMSYEVNETKNSGINHNKFRFGIARNRKKSPINSREAEERLSKILERLANHNYKVIFILDEIDKLSDYEERSGTHGHSEKSPSNKTTQIDSMLGSLKNYFTTAQATFIFISGRETLDRYYSEKGSPNSLYESLFDQVFEVPSFLTDEGERPRGTQLTHLIEEYVCRSLERRTVGSFRSEYTLSAYYQRLPENQKDKNIVFTSVLRSFIYYLTFHSWGNPKRLSSIFESFVVPQSHITRLLREQSATTLQTDYSDHWLLIKTNHHHSFSFASEMITLFQHQLNREISRISDKLTVSTLVSLHFILKLHAYAFTRESLHRMSEAIDVHRSPELNTIIDDLLTHVLKPYIRRVRNGSYRYRFNSSFTQELNHISQYSDLESASHHFSLDSMRHVKRIFENIIADKSKDTCVIAGAHVTLGDICAIEQSYNDASAYYRTACNFYYKQLIENKYPIKQEVLMQYTDAMIKQGDLEETRQNYNYAAAIYSDAEYYLKSILTLKSSQTLRQKLRDGDSKLDTLKQPFWANQFLSLKRSPRKNTRIPCPKHFFNKEDPRYYLRAANLYFFLNDAHSSAKAYQAALSYLRQNNPYPNERNAYLGGNAKVGLAEATLIDQSSYLFNIQLKTSSPERIAFFKELLIFLNTPKSAAPYSSNIIDLMKEAAEYFETNQLYKTAAITYIKIICYYTQILDIFDFNIVRERSENHEKDQLPKLIERIKSNTVIFGIRALDCINKVRQLETNQACKTLLMRDLHDSDDQDMEITQLFTLLLDTGNTHDDQEPEMLFWQSSIWAHKLAAALLWADFVIRKIEGSEKPEKLCRTPSDLSPLSARSSIIIRWIRARDLNYRFIDQNLISVNYEPLSVLKVLNSDKNYTKNIELSERARDFTRYCLASISDEKFPTLLKIAYRISRDLYFALRSIHFTSRKNCDLVFPNTTQVYHTQWKMLASLLAAILIQAKLDNRENGPKSIRDFSLLLQKVLVRIDEKEAPYNRIPASHFDYEYIIVMLSSSLEDAINLVDQTSRTRTNILQHKYFCHDDHSDSEFRMDYTLAYMFIPSAQYLKEQTKGVHKNLEEASTKNIHAQWDCDFIQASKHYERNEYKLAVFFHRKAASRANPFSSAALAILYNQGLGGEKKNQERGDYWARQAINRLAPYLKYPNPQAAYSLAGLLQHGIGIEKDEEAARNEYNKAANKGHPAAQFELGKIYYAKKKYTIGRGYYEKSAKQGYVASQLALIDIYKNGDGVKKCKRQVAHWKEQKSLHQSASNSP